MKEQLQNKFTYGKAYIAPKELERRRENREKEQEQFRNENDQLNPTDKKMLQELWQLSPKC